MATEYPLSLVIKAVDKATAPLREINQRIERFTAPVRRLNNSFRALSDEAGFPRLATGMRGVAGAMGGVLHQVGALALKLGGLALGGGFLGHLVLSAVEAGDQLAKTARRVGLTVDAFAQLRFAAVRAGIEQEEFTTGMMQFAKRLGDAKAGTGGLLTFLNKVSPALAAQVKHAKGTDEAFDLMVRAFERVTDPAKRAALAAAAFGRGGLKMGEFLGRGRKELAELRQRFVELRGSQEQSAQNSERLADALEDTKTAFLGLRGAALGPLLPVLTDFARAITDIAVANRGQLAASAREAAAAIAGWLKGGGLERLIATMREWAGIIGTVFTAIGGLKGVLVLLGAYMASGLVTSVLSLVGAFWKLGAAALPWVIRGGMLLLPVIGKLIAGLMALNLANPLFWIAALGAALAAAAYLVWKHWEPIKRFFVDLWEKVKAIGSWVFGSQGMGSPAAGPTLGAARVAQPGTQLGSAHVKVDFSNLPRGARVTQGSSGGADLDLNMGYSLLLP